MRAERAPSALNLFGLTTALMIALAGGAVWALAALFRQETLAFLALPLGILIGRVLAGTHGPRGTLPAALCAALFSLLASGYALWMIAGGRVALLLGMRLSETLGSIGLDLAFAMTRAWLTTADLVLLAGGAALAAAAAAWYRRPPALAQSSEPAKE
ncbi:MAG: hypothetical protein BGP24_22925 [Lysobacterales bacterium 69-70]|nr:hypothetical protein [Xanthomonadaceae bacterium]ODU34244.1 MAG: hypothetical protein ABS97_09105 [Xanthomonadaceae bacterium SCN 69-320]ODV18498.1 MAG: hypothetical protein ABT27_13340 [Xanthomonadaceae bacterium SCN 69-25]OJY96151.1 MAG: hypothetical protein BGP24_22925 [Xanthomonadales bacterium 69-70]